MIATLIYFATFLICTFTFWNVVRGGWPNMQNKPWWKKSDYLWWIASMLALSVAFGWREGTAMGTGFWAAMLTGWGVYIGAILNRKNALDPAKPYFNGGTGQYQADPQEEVKWIDKIIWPLRKNPLHYGLAGMFFRGLMGGIIMAAVTYLAKFGWHLAGYELDLPNLLPIIAGFAAMPVGYWVASVIPGIPSNKVWSVGEAIWGFLIGLGVFIAKLIQLTAKKGK